MQRTIATAGLLALVISGCACIPVLAHPADEIIERDLIHIGPDGITIDMTISAGAIKLLKVWADADTDNNKQVNAAEREAFGQFLATGYETRIDGVGTPTTYQPGSLVIADTLSAFEVQAADPSGATVHAAFTVPFVAASTRHEIAFRVNHYTAYSNDRPPELYPDAAEGMAIAIQGGADVDLRLTTAPAAASSPARTVESAANPRAPRVTPLLQAVRDPDGGPRFIVFGIAIAIALGAVHALTPGHGKTLMAAYLVGDGGTIGRACALGGVITLTHTGSVLALGVLAVLLAGTVVPEHVILWIELVSSLSIIALGIALLHTRFRSAWQTQRAMARRRNAVPVSVLAAATSTGEGRGAVPALPQHGWHEHEDGTTHAHNWFGGQAHTHAIPARFSWKALIAMGVSGGIVPCPDALAILLVAMAAGHILLGIVIILGFSAGLAAVLVVIGVLLTSTRVLQRASTRWSWLERIGPWLPAASAAIIVLLGVVAFVRAFPVIRA